MSYYDSFDCKVQFEELALVSEDEYNEVLREMALEREAEQSYGDWSDEDQRLWEAEQERLKRWTRNYSSNDDGDFYAGLAI
jgi:hypothetical protein